MVVVNCDWGEIRKGKEHLVEMKQSRTELVITNETEQMFVSSILSIS